MWRSVEMRVSLLSGWAAHRWTELHIYNKAFQPFEQRIENLDLGWKRWWALCVKGLLCIFCKN
jgi:hypothetical protein